MNQDQMMDAQYGQPAVPEDHQMGGADDPGNGEYINGQRGHHVSQSADYPQSNQTFSPTFESEQGSRYNSPNLQYQQAPQPTSRPDSGLSGQQDYPRQYQDQNGQQKQPNKNSVVIKVGMVGDAQIGKTSLMVKYVEGSWDEDYIQTLGMWENTTRVQ